MLEALLNCFFAPSGEFLKQRDAFLQSRKAVYLMNEEFVKNVFQHPSDGERKIAVILRRIVAKKCLVEPEKIIESDRVIDLAWLVEDERCTYESPLRDLNDELWALTGLPRGLKEERIKTVFFFPREVNEELMTDSWPDWSKSVRVLSTTFGDWTKEATSEVLQELGRLGEEI